MALPVSSIGPSVGLSSVARKVDRHAPLPSASDSRLIGGQVKQSVFDLYHQKTLRDIALDMTQPEGVDSALLEPRRFEAAMLDAYDKVSADGSGTDARSDAHAVLSDLKEVWQLCRYQIDALNQV